METYLGRKNSVNKQWMIMGKGLGQVKVCKVIGKQHQVMSVNACFYSVGSHGCINQNDCIWICLNRRLVFKNPGHSCSVIVLEYRCDREVRVRISNGSRCYLVKYNDEAYRLDAPISGGKKGTFQSVHLRQSVSIEVTSKPKPGLLFRTVR